MSTPTSDSPRLVLDEADLAADPILQFQRWFDEARAAKFFEPAAMALATADAAGHPSLRMVLFKGLHEGGFCFYTNYDSRKSAELGANPHAALTFWWDRFERQIRIEGRIERLPRAMSDRYFHSRPRGSQLAAYTSQQSAVLASRGELEARIAENDTRFAGGEVPLPDDWGGFRVIPESFEFWQGRANRVHDRLVYRRNASSWTIERLQP